MKKIMKKQIHEIQHINILGSKNIHGDSYPELQETNEEENNVLDPLDGVESIHVVTSIEMTYSEMFKGQNDILDESHERSTFYVSDTYDMAFIF